MTTCKGLGLEIAGRFVAPSGVIHAGGHHGEEAPYYAAHGVATVVWIEAEPQAFDVLTGTVQPYPGHHCIRMLAGDRDGDERLFYRHRFPGGQKRGYCSTLPWNMTVVARDPVLSRLETFDVLPMRTTTMATALREGGFAPSRFDYLSINVQGAELMVLRGMGEYLTPLRWIFCEAEADAQTSRYQGAPSIADVAAWLAQHGFRAAWPLASRQQLYYRCQ